MTLLFLSFFTAVLMSCGEAEATDPTPDEPIGMDMCDQLYPPLDTVITSHTNFAKGHYPKRIQQFQQDTIAPGDVVMLGNSLTEQGGNWGAKLGISSVKNRGISGDNTDGVMARLNELLCNEPSTVFLMIGTNDLWVNYSADKVAGNIDQIATALMDELPETRVIVQTIMPLAAGHEKQDKLIAINNLLLGMDARPYELADTHTAMSNEAGDLPQEYTTDGVHLTVAGYSKWVELLTENL
ncbi:MAG: GDSL-type esterase/lipase family protein [Cyclobacteriaceae bacterium]